MREAAFFFLGLWLGALAGLLAACWVQAQARRIRRGRWADQPYRCEEPGCLNEAMPCYLSGDPEPSEWWCSEHAFEHGFCRGCGQFWAGIESFDFGPGYCPNCRDEIQADEGAFDEDVDDVLCEEDLPDEAFQEA
jgi:hypothetical protein